MAEGMSPLFLISCIGVLNGFILSFYFFYSSIPDQKQNRFLAMLFLVLSIRIGKSVIFFFLEDVDAIAFYIQIGLSACFLIGPFLYFYTCSFFQKKPFATWWGQSLFFVGLISVIGYYYPYFSFRSYWWDYFIPIIQAQWLFYIALSTWLIWENRGVLNVETSNFINKRNWIISIVLGVALIWLAYVTCSLTSYIVGALSFTFVVYIIIFLLLMGFNRMNILNPTPQKYGGKTIEHSTSKEIYTQLLKALEKQYQNPKLTLGDLSASTDYSKHQISQVLNEHYKMNFSSFLRNFRIEKVKSLILSNHNYTLEAIGKECGFKAKSTFFTAFKQETGLTPAQFKQQQLS